MILQLEKGTGKGVMGELMLGQLVFTVPVYRCARLSYPSSLPQASIIMPFYNEWQSVLLRTVYSIINRSPRHLLHQIVLVDDGSSLGNAADWLFFILFSSTPHFFYFLIQILPMVTCQSLSLYPFISDPFASLLFDLALSSNRPPSLSISHYLLFLLSFSFTLFIYTSPA